MKVYKLTAEKQDQTDALIVVQDKKVFIEFPEHRLSIDIGENSQDISKRTVKEF